MFTLSTLMLATLFINSSTEKLFFTAATSLLPMLLKKVFFKAQFKKLKELHLKF